MSVRVHGFWRNEYNSISNEEMGSYTLDLGNFLTSVLCLVINQAFLDKIFDSRMREDFNFSLRCLTFSLFCVSTFCFRYFVSSIFCPFHVLYFDILYFRYSVSSIFCLFNKLPSMFCHFDIFYFDILPFRYYILSVFCVSIFCHGSSRAPPGSPNTLFGTPRFHRILTLALWYRASRASLASSHASLPVGGPCAQMSVATPLHKASTI